MLKINTKKARIIALENRCAALEAQTRSLAVSTLTLGTSLLLNIGLNHRAHKKQAAATAELEAQLVAALKATEPAPEKVQAEVVAEEPAGEGGKLFGNYSKKEPEAEKPEAPSEEETK